MKKVELEYKKSMAIKVKLHERLLDVTQTMNKQRTAKYTFG